MLRALALLLVAALALGGLFVALRPDRSAEGPEKRTIDVEVQGDAMSPTEITVGHGDEVTLKITAERPVELHLHGYDLEKEVEPEETPELSFEADLTGRFEIEDEQTDRKSVV